jgi:hypothetical protein
VILVFNNMNKNSQISIGKVSAAQTDLGVPTPELVERRAREIALIDGRNPDEFTDSDWEQARLELTGMQGSGSLEEPGEIAASLSERGSIPGETGGRAPRVMPKDEALLDERLTSRGVEEAAHDQMVEAAKTVQKQEG